MKNVTLKSCCLSLLGVRIWLYERLNGCSCDIYINGVFRTSLVYDCSYSFMLSYFLSYNYKVVHSYCF